MDAGSLDRLYGENVPEDVMSKITFAVGGKGGSVLSHLPSATCTGVNLGRSCLPYARGPAPPGCERTKIP
ncbi:MAG: hypothetical protein BJ554DRAFT_6257 [Olpidium bornovanus]|uniref:Uncharacterized protein n=1 Tax=Olpidium bornovanus TaxID=278681 RepID=A0A8H7ZXV8_9FUNG|nr:MAG: hypothetical protein BJ554DRAFT_6257 [Olpidium bornovanus]